jgi:hypothetical protein
LCGYHPIKPKIAGAMMSRDKLKAVELAGFIVGFTTLLFFMGIVLLSFAGRTIPCSARFLVVVVLALGAAMASAFIGGSAAAKGSIPLPYHAASPIRFGVGGGVAVLILVLVIGWWLYVYKCVDHPRMYQVSEVRDKIDLSAWSPTATGLLNPGIRREVHLKVIRLEPSAGPFQTHVGFAGAHGSFTCIVKSQNGSCYQDTTNLNPDREIWIVSAPASGFALHTPTELWYFEEYRDTASFQFPDDRSALASCRACDVSYRVPYWTQIYQAEFTLPPGFSKAAFHRVVRPPDTDATPALADFDANLPATPFTPTPLNDLEGFSSISFYLALVPDSRTR